MKSLALTLALTAAQAASAQPQQPDLPDYDVQQQTLICYDSFPTTLPFDLLTIEVGSFTRVGNTTAKLVIGETTQYLFGSAVITGESMHDFTVEKGEEFVQVTTNDADDTWQQCGRGGCVGRKVIQATFTMGDHSGVFECDLEQ